MQLIHAAQIVDKDRPGGLGRCGRPIDIDFLPLAVVRPQPDEIALVADDVDELILPKETPQGRIVLPHFLAGLDRDSQMILVAELETDDRMGDPWRSSIGDEQIGTTYVLKVIDPRLPMRGVVLFRSIVEVADIMDRDLDTIELRPGR